MESWVALTDHVVATMSERTSLDELRAVFGPMIRNPEVGPTALALERGTELVAKCELEGVKAGVASAVARAVASHLQKEGIRAADLAADPGFIEAVAKRVNRFFDEEKDSMKIEIEVRLKAIG